MGIQMCVHVHAGPPALPKIVDQSMPVELGICRSLVMSGIDENENSVTDNILAQKLRSGV